MGVFHDRLLEELELRGFSNNTKTAYVYGVREFINFHQKSPDKLGLSDIKGYQYFLIKTKKMNPKSVNQQTAAITFFYRNVLNRAWPAKTIPRIKCQLRIPVMLTLDEIQKVLNTASNIKHKALLMTMYSSGLRVSEVLNLKHFDIDSKRMVINIKNGKGGKDRQAILSPYLLDCLREY
ncbi:MAG: site-specific integrase [Oligoflexia bacterium]|nr:site-specific integrase [Oligoflexia bacterium]